MGVQTNQQTDGQTEIGGERGMPGDEQDGRPREIQAGVILLSKAEHQHHRGRDSRAGGEGGERARGGGGGGCGKEREIERERLRETEGERD